MQQTPTNKIPVASVGRLERYANVFDDSGILPRIVDVWLPPNYDQNPDLRCNVLYMHDGQNLFDRELAYGGQTWGIAESLVRLELPPTIVVGIWNSQQRWRDYYPQVGFDALPDQQKMLGVLGGTPNSRQYAKLIAQHLKPLIDRTYRTLPTRDHTYIMGSSMGGLISLYSLTEHPDVFGGAGCVSSHWLAGENIMVDALAAALPKPNQHRLYFDYGTETLDAGYEPFQQRMNQHLEQMGWNSFVCHKFEGAAHDEASWRKRLKIPLRFLLGQP
jgi:predicted alpha/beta superfamily hydrolase